MEKTAAAPQVSFPEPNALEVFVMVFFGNLLSQFYQEYVDRLDLTGSERVLELGPAAGSSTRHLAKRLLKGGGSVTAVDISRVYIQAARKRLRKLPNIQWVHGDICTLNIANNSFDAGFICFVVHDIPSSDRAQVMQSFAAKLAPGAKLFIREPLRFIPMDELRQTLQASGLTETSWLVKEIKTQGPVYEGIYTKPGGSR
jgi:ubiquinone/menaquinone biosynthesis C-methylase UbiE